MRGPVEHAGSSLHQLVSKREMLLTITLGRAPSLAVLTPHVAALNTLAFHQLATDPRTQILLFYATQVLAHLIAANSKPMSRFFSPTLS
jgi:hypothetical protein